MDLISIEHNEKLIIDKGKITYKKGESLDEIYELVHLTKVSVLTSAIGYSLEDFALALFFGTIVLLLPYNQECYGDIFKKISAIININYDNYIEAMGAIESSEYILWEIL